MKNITKRFFFYLILLCHLILNAKPVDPCPLAVLVSDLSTSSTEFKIIVKDSDGFNAWLVLNKEAPSLRTNLVELKLVSKNLAEINSVGGYVKWKEANSSSALNLSQVLRSNLNQLGVSDDISKYSLAPNSRGGAYIFTNVSVEEKEITLADEILSLTNQKCIFPKNNLQAIEGFLENGTPFTMKELESNFNNFITRINEMYTKIKTDPNFQWTGSEGYLKIPFNSFIKTDGTSQTVTKAYVEQQFNAGIARNGFKIKNDGTVQNITVFLGDGTAFKLDLTKLKQ